MIHALLFPLVVLFALLATQPVPAHAQTKAECDAYLCLPAGFHTWGGTPTTACDPAERAVRDRIARGLPALPPWSSCAVRWGYDAANLSHTEPRTESCPDGGTASGGMCRYRDANGCTYSYQSRETVTVTVGVDGSTTFQPNHPFTVETRPAGTPALDPPTQNPLFCRPPPPPPIIPGGGGSCTQTAGPGLPPPYYIVTTGCPCPSGYPFIWSQGGRLYCLANPGRP